MISIQQAWCRETSADPDEWTEDNRALGQCAVTALVVQDFLGGVLVRAETAAHPRLESVGSHYWNRLENGDEIDLTREQFASNVVFRNVDLRPRSYLLSHPDTARRYALLRERVGLC